MNCCGINKPYSKYTTTTKFSEYEIKDLRAYFNKYTKNKMFMEFQEFRNSIGILGTKGSGWICRRMFDLILEKSKSDVVSVLVILK